MHFVTFPIPPSVLAYAQRGDCMHVFTHSFDYIALGILIACMFVAASRLIWPRGSSRQGQAAGRIGRK
jgi:hypothetical protein